MLFDIEDSLAAARTKKKKGGKAVCLLNWSSKENREKGSQKRLLWYYGTKV